MTGELSPFEMAAAELRALGLTLRSLPGEFCVNYRYGAEATAQMAENLGEAVELGRAMAAARTAIEPPYRRSRRPRRKRYNGRGRHPRPGWKARRSKPKGM